ncbi:MAG: SGNH/GDSL hydrolase family protein [Mesorhizobium sp.]|nr:MAG: SGNH/GDSL hydrolase family protein [Mesorhizobium sp.]
MANEVAAAFDTAFRDYVTDGVPSSGTHKPAKSNVRGIGPIVDAQFVLVREEMAAIEADTVAAVEVITDALDERVDIVEALAVSGIRWITQRIEARSTGNVDLATGLVNGQTLNGVTVETGKFYFLGSQTLPAQNGLYIGVAAGTATRAAFADTAAELAYIGFLLQGGSAGAGERWMLPLAVADITLETTALVFAPAGIEVSVTSEVVVARNGEATLNEGIISRLGGATFFEYETREDGDAAIIDADGNVIEIFTAGEDPSTDLADAAGDRDSLADRLDLTLDPYGNPRRHIWNEWKLRETRLRLRQLLVGVASTQFIAAFIGDSWTYRSQRFTEKVTNKLVADYGDAGGGWTGFGVTGSGGLNGNARTTYGYSRSGTWTDDEYAESVSPDISHITSTTAGSKVTVTGPALPVLSLSKLFWIGTANGVVRYRWNGGAWTSLNVQGTVGGLETADLAGLPASGAWTLEIEVVSGTCSLAGIDLRATANGVRVHKLGASGSRANHWSDVDATKWRSGLALLNPRLCVICLGVNDKANDIAPATYATNLGTIIDRIQAEIPSCDIMVMMPCETASTETYTMSQYAYEAAKVAAQQGVAWLDLQYVFGDAVAIYEDGSDRSWLASDGIHPTDDGGGGVIADVVIRTLTH